MKKETNNSYKTHTDKGPFNCTRITFIGYHYLPSNFLLQAIHYTGNAKNITQSLFQNNNKRHKKWIKYIILQISVQK